jgi:hypothetical protein
MLNLSVLTRKTRTFFSIGWCDKFILLEALFFTGVARLIIFFIPFDKYKKYIGAYKKETLLEIDLEDYKVIRKISWAIKLVSKCTPWESKCLVQALTAQKMLKRRKIGSTLYLGVNKDENNNMKAHSWLRSGQFIVTGGRYKSEFAEVARFGYEVNNKN